MDLQPLRPGPFSLGAKSAAIGGWFSIIYMTVTSRMCPYKPTKIINAPRFVFMPVSRARHGAWHWARYLEMGWRGGKEAISKMDTHPV